MQFQFSKDSKMGKQDLNEAKPRRTHLQRASEKYLSYWMYEWIVLIIHYNDSCLHKKENGKVFPQKSVENNTFQHLNEFPKPLQEQKLLKGH